MLVPDIPVILPPDDVLQLDECLGKGLQSGEVALPEDKTGTYGIFQGMLALFTPAS